MRKGECSVAALAASLPALVAAEADIRLDPAERRRHAQSYAGASLEWRERAGRTGFFDVPKNREQADGDGDLASAQSAGVSQSAAKRCQSPASWSSARVGLPPRAVAPYNRDDEEIRKKQEPCQPSRSLGDCGGPGRGLGRRSALGLGRSADRIARVSRWSARPRAFCWKLGLRILVHAGGRLAAARA